MLIHKEIKKKPQRITNIKPFIDKYNWEGRNYSSERHEWKKMEIINLANALNVLYVRKLYPACLSKHNSNRQKQGSQTENDGIILQ